MRPQVSPTPKGLSRAAAKADLSRAAQTAARSGCWSHRSAPLILAEELRENGLGLFRLLDPGEVPALVQVLQCGARNERVNVLCHFVSHGVLVPMKDQDRASELLERLAHVVVCADIPKDEIAGFAMQDAVGQVLRHGQT